MVLNDISSITSGANSSNPTLVNNITESKDQFLKLLLAQLKNQDPLSPQDPSKFTEQMTSFGQLEQLFNLNSTMGKVLSAQPSMQRSEALGLVGKEISAKGDGIRIQGADKGKIGYQLQYPAKDVTIQVTDSSGNVLRVINAGNSSAGAHLINFDGLNSSGTEIADGNYQFKVSAQDKYGESIAVDPLVVGRVNTVEFGSNGPMLIVNGAQINMGDIITVGQGA